jgi:hypothetical protein
MNNDIQNICESIAFTPKDIKAINAARQQAEDINAVIGKCLGDPAHAPLHEFFSWLHLEVDTCEAELVETPTHENAEKLHAAIVRFDQAKQSQERICGALNTAGQRISQSLAGIVQAHLDKVQLRIESEADLRRAELKPSNHALFSNADEKRQLEARVQALLAELATERTEALQDPLGWIERNGLAMDEPVQADTEAA